MTMSNRASTSLTLGSLESFSVFEELGGTRGMKLADFPAANPGEANKVSCLIVDGERTPFVVARSDQLEVKFLKRASDMELLYN